MQTYITRGTCSRQILFDVNEENYNLKNVVINKAFLGNCQNVFNVKQKGKIVFNNIFGKHVENQSGEVVNNS